MKAIDYSKIGERIHFYRSKKGLTQDELGMLVYADLNHISRVEIGKRRPSLELVVQLANALEVSANDLLFDSLEHPTDSDELHAFLMDCSETEKQITLETLRFLKTLFKEHRI